MRGAPGLPEWLEESPLGMSNLDHSIDEGFEAALRTGRFLGRHFARNFNGEVWFSGGQFREDVWVHHAFAGTTSAPSLRELMDAVNEKYGSG
jgi:hypothetical protein